MTSAIIPPLRGARRAWLRQTTAMRRAGLCLLSVLGWAFSCTTDHGILAKKPGSGGAGGASAAGGTPGDAQADEAGDGSFDAADGFVEPTGSSVVTLLHAVADAPRIGFCFARGSAATAELVDGPPQPSGGLQYGGVWITSSLTGIDLKLDALQPIVVAAPKIDLETKSCQVLIEEGQLEELPVLDAGVDGSDGSDDAGGVDAAADAAAQQPPPVRARALPVLPPTTLDSGYSTLFAVAGCLGGPTFDDSLATLVCGTGYTPTTPTVTPVLVRMSRVTKADVVGIQVVNARAVSEAVTVVTSGPDGTSLPSLTVAYDVQPGQIAPKPPYLGVSAAVLGFPGEPTLELSAGGNVALEVSWAHALAPTGVTKVENGRNYSVVVLGPQLNVSVVKWWNPPSAVVVRSDP